MHHLKFEKLWFALGYILIVAVVLLSLIPPPAVDGAEFINGMDIVFHLFAYGILMMWFSQLCPRNHRMVWALRFFVLGTLLELVQPLTGYRSFEFQDILANALGISVGWGLVAHGIGTFIFFIENQPFKNNQPFEG